MTQRRHDDAEFADLLRVQLERAEELERRALGGTDNVAYCIKWSGIHRRMVAELMEAD